MLTIVLYLVERDKNSCYEMCVNMGRAHSRKRCITILLCRAISRQMDS